MNIETILNILFILRKYTGDTDKLMCFDTNRINFWIDPEKISNRDRLRLTALGISITKVGLTYEI